MPPTPTDGADRTRLILLADDDADTVEGYVLLLQAQGYRTALAGDGARALSETARLLPDLVLLDLGLPVISGWEVLEGLRASPSTASIPVVVLTGHVFPDQLRRAEEAGCSAILRKPCSADVLLDTVREWMGRLPLTPGPDGATGPTILRAPKPGYTRCRVPAALARAVPAPELVRAECGALLAAVSDELARAGRLCRTAAVRRQRAAGLLAHAAARRSA
jgi:CheY-like chemotaxis protein